MTPVRLFGSISVLKIPSAISATDTPVFADYGEATNKREKREAGVGGGAMRMTIARGAVGKVTDMPVSISPQETLVEFPLALLWRDCGEFPLSRPAWPSNSYALRWTIANITISKAEAERHPDSASSGMPSVLKGTAQGFGRRLYRMTCLFKSVDALDPRRW